METEHVETLIIGGGFSGVKMALLLPDHLLLEREAKLFHVWKENRWDSFEFNTPSKLNDLEDEGEDKVAFQDQVKLWDAQASRINVRLSHQVVSVSFRNEGRKRFEIRARNLQDDFTLVITSTNVICCSGNHDIPFIPNMAHDLKVKQLHSVDYKGAHQFPDNEAILVVGSGQSGVQIADDLARNNKSVWLATGNSAGSPRLHRGDHFFDWVKRMGINKMTNEMRLQRPDAERLRYSKPPHVGSRHAISYFSLQRQGVTIAGRFRGKHNNTLEFEDDRLDNVKKSIESYEGYTTRIEAWISSQPAETREIFQAQENKKEQEWEVDSELLSLPGPKNLPVSECQAIIWCTGYKATVHDYMPPETQGDLNSRTKSPDMLVSKACPGLYYLGFPWVRAFFSSILLGIRQDAAVIAEKIRSEKQNVE